MEESYRQLYYVYRRNVDDENKEIQQRQLRVDALVEKGPTAEDVEMFVVWGDDLLNKSEN